MSHTPPVPQGNQSPYPIQEPPHAPVASNLPVVVPEADAAPVVDRLKSLPYVAIGAAVGLGVALLGGVFFGLRSVKPKRGRGRGRGKRRG